MSQIEPTVNENGVDEKDKPFILALTGTFGLIGAGVYGIVMGNWEATERFLTILSPLVVMGWSFYFKGKT